MKNGNDFWREFCLGSGPIETPALLVFAHPDDESIGVGSQLRRWTHASLVCVTDGAPFNPDFATERGFNSRWTYAAARRAELERALELAGWNRSRWECWDYVDQELSHHFAELVDRLWYLLKKKRPRVLLTHAYEGGHPDHDSLAWICRAVIQILREHSDPVPVLGEVAFYHGAAMGWVSGEFLPSPEPISVRFLSTEEQTFKHALFSCYDTQREVLSGFDLSRESYRLAPPCDFTQPPHEGQLFYEQMNWGITGEQWREQAREAAQKTGVLC